MKPLLVGVLFLGLSLQAQPKPEILKDEVIRIETTLASDAMQGRQVFTAGADSAAVFIAKEFSKIGLKYYESLGFRLSR